MLCTLHEIVLQGITHCVLRLCDVHSMGKGTPVNGSGRIRRVHLISEWFDNKQIMRVVSI